MLAEYALEADYDGVDADLNDIERNYTLRGGLFRVVVTGDTGPEERIVGCAGLFPLDRDHVELRKMYLLPEARRQGIGRRLLDESIDQARRLGYRHVRLETASVLTEAIALYQRAGFRRIETASCADRCDQAWILDIEAEKPDDVQHL